MLNDFEKDPDEILATARIMAKTLLNEHIAKANGLAINEHNLNPYVSAGARADFQRGFYGTVEPRWTDLDRSLSYRFQLGRAVAVLCKAKGL